MQLTRIDYRAEDAPQALTQSLHQTGFAVLRHVPIADDLIQQTYQEWAVFFGLEQKHAYRFDPQLQSGYFPFQSEQAKGYTVPDLKEFFHLYAWSQLPQGMSDCSWQLFHQLRQLAIELLGWIQRHSPPAIQAQFTMPLSEMIRDSQETLMRPIHYPPLWGEVQPGAIRAAAHEDINLITLLPTATATGLELQDHQGNWMAVPSDRGDMIVNVGDMLQMASDRYFRSATHRVVNPVGDAAQISRFSMPLFLHPQPDTILASQTTAKMYLQDRLQEIGLLS